MTETESQQITPGFTAFATAFFGSILLVIGFILSIFIWPIGLLIAGFGVLAIVGSPLVWILARSGSELDGAETPSA